MVKCSIASRKGMYFMSTQGNNESGVAACLALIEAEYIAGQRGLSSYAIVSQHAFITARMEGMKTAFDKLLKAVGDEDESKRLMSERLDQIPEVLGNAS
jgi:hypothetical protein